MSYSILNLLLDSTIAISLDLLIALFLFYLYRPILHGPFTFDDLTILNNLPYLRRIDPMTRTSEPPLHRSVYLSWLSRHSSVVFMMSPVRLLGVIGSRPITNWLYEFNVSTGGLNPYHFHLTSLAVGIACTITLNHILGHFLHPLAAFIGALLLAAHPLATMSISYIAGRSSLLCALFILLSILALLNGWALAMVLMVVLALLSKEEGIAAVPILLWMWMGGIGI